MAARKAQVGISHKQVKMIKIAAKSLHVELSLPEVTVNEAHMKEASSVVSAWMKGGWTPTDGTPSDVEEAIASRLAFATALAAEGVSRKAVNESISYWKAVKNRRDVSPARKASGFLDRLGVEGRFAPPASEATVVTFTAPAAAPAQQQLGFGGAAIGRVAAQPAAPAVPTASAVALAGQLAAQGLDANAISEALQGLKRAGLI